MIILTIVAYAVIWFVVLQETVLPTIHQVVTTPFVWNNITSLYLINIVISVVLIMLLIITPFMFILVLKTKLHEKERDRNEADDRIKGDKIKGGEPDVKKEGG